MLPRLLATLIFCFSLPAETVQLIPQTYYRTFAHTNPVLKRIRPGDVVITKTLDSGGQDYKNENRSEPSNPLTGPFFIEGAEPGDSGVGECSTSRRAMLFIEMS